MKNWKKIVIFLPVMVVGFGGYKVYKVYNTPDPDPTPSLTESFEGTSIVIDGIKKPINESAGLLCLRTVEVDEDGELYFDTSFNNGRVRYAGLAGGSKANILMRAETGRKSVFQWLITEGSGFFNIIEPLEDDEIFDVLVIVDGNTWRFPAKGTAFRVSVNKNASVDVVFYHGEAPIYCNNELKGYIALGYKGQIDAEGKEWSDLGKIQKQDLDREKMSSLEEKYLYPTDYEGTDSPISILEKETKDAPPLLTNDQAAEKFGSNISDTYTRLPVEIIQQTSHVEMLKAQVNDLTKELNEAYEQLNDSLIENALNGGDPEVLQSLSEIIEKRIEKIQIESALYPERKAELEKKLADALAEKENITIKSAEIILAESGQYDEISKLEALLADAQKDLNNARAELESLQKEYDETLASTVAEWKDKVAVLEDKLESANELSASQIAELQTSLTEAKDAISVLEGKLESADELSANQIAELQTLLTEAKDAVADLEGKLESADKLSASQIAELQTSLTEAKDAVADLEGKLEGADKLSASQIAELQTSLTKAKDSMAVLEDKLESANKLSASQIEELQISLTEARDALDISKAMHESENSRILAEHSLVIAQYEQQIVDLGNEKAEVESKLNKATLEASVYENELARLDESYNSIKAEYDTEKSKYNTALEKANLELTSAKDEIDVLNNKIAVIDARLESLNLESVADAATIIKLEADKNKLLEELGAANDKFEAERAKISADHKNEVDRLKDELVGVREEHYGEILLLQAKITSAENAYADSESKYREHIEALVADHESKLKDLDSTIEELSKTLATTTNNTDKLEQALANAISEREATEAMLIAEQDRINNEWAPKLATLEAELADTQAELNKAIADGGNNVANLQKQLEDIISELDVAKQKHEQTLEDTAALAVDHENKLNDLDSTIEGLRIALTAAENNADRLEQELAKANIARDTAEVMLLIEQDRISNEWATRFAELEIELANTQAELDKKTTDDVNVANLEKQLEAVTSELATAKLKHEQTLENKDRTIGELRDTIATIEGENVNLQIALANALNATSSGSNEEIENLHREISALNNELVAREERIKNLESLLDDALAQVPSHDIESLRTHINALNEYINYLESIIKNLPSGQRPPDGWDSGRPNL